MIRSLIRRILGKSELPGVVTMSADTHTIDLFRFHPITGRDANDLEGFRTSDEHKAEIAEMIRKGASFYWKRAGFLESDESSQQGYIRVEWQNFSFAAFATGQNIVRHEADWTKNKPGV